MNPSTSSPPIAPLQAFYFPFETEDYKIAKGDIGLGLVANRHIKKSELIFSDSLEYNFADVVDGDQLLLHRGGGRGGDDDEEEEGDDGVPQYFPVTRDMLLRQHGVPTLTPDPSGKTAGTISWQLEMPGMLMNHSCDPTSVDYLDEDGEGRASRDIAPGEELRADYALCFYDTGSFLENCCCGAAKCRGYMKGFKGLSEDEKKLLFPRATDAVQAMYLADIGEGPPVKHEQVIFPPRRVSNTPRLVCPGPSTADAEVVVQETETNSLSSKFALFAMRDFGVGERVYSFWNSDWPDTMPENMDMVFASPFEESDPPEGMVVHMDASTLQGGGATFTGWELLARQHSSDEPNLTYKESEEDESWRSAYAVKEIKAGDKLIVGII